MAERPKGRGRGVGRIGPRVAEVRDLADGPAGALLRGIHRLNTDGHDGYVALSAQPADWVAQQLAVGTDLLVLVIPAGSTVRPFAAAQIVVDTLSSEPRLEDRLAVVVTGYERDDILALEREGRRRNLEFVVIPSRILSQPIDEIERHLATHLFSPDPFRAEGPVSDDRDFYGRRSEVLALARDVQEGRIRSLFALRHAGKTSVLDRIQKIGASNHSFLTTVIDCEDDRVWRLGAEHIVEAIIGSLISACDSGFGYSSVNAESSYGQESELWSKLRHLNLPAVILIDEADSIAPSVGSGMSAHDFGLLWRLLRRFHSEATRQGCSVGLLVAGVSSEAFRAQMTGDQENSARRIVPDEYLQPFDRAASRAMVQSLGNHCGLRFSEHEAAHIARECGDMPYWLRQAGAFIHRAIDVSTRPHQFAAGDVEDLVAEFVTGNGSRELAVDLEYLIRRSPVAAAVLADLARDKVMDRALLVNYGVMAQDGIPALMKKAVARLSDFDKLRAPDPQS